MELRTIVAGLKGIFKVFDANEREIRRMMPLVEQINQWGPEYRQLSDEALAAKTDEFLERLAGGEGLDDILPEAFAAVREASRRTTGLVHFDVQLIGGVILHRGKIVEMKTGEGKTLVATLPLYLNALSLKGVHLITPNDYLSKVGIQWMGPIYHALGLSVGVIQSSKAETAGGSFLVRSRIQIGRRTVPEFAAVLPPGSLPGAHHLRHQSRIWF